MAACCSADIDARTRKRADYNKIYIIAFDPSRIDRKTSRRTWPRDNPAPSTMPNSRIARRIVHKLAMSRRAKYSKPLMTPHARVTNIHRHQNRSIRTPRPRARYSRLSCPQRHAVGRNRHGKRRSHRDGTLRDYGRVQGKAGRRGDSQPPIAIAAPNRPPRPARRASSCISAGRTDRSYPSGHPRHGDWTDARLRRYPPHRLNARKS